MNGKGGLGKTSVSVNLAIALANKGYQVGLDETTNNIYDIWFCNLNIGELDMNLYKFHPGRNM